MEALTLPASMALAAGMQCSSLPACAAPPSAPACAALAVATASPPALMLPAGEASVSCDGSLESCSTELAVPVAVPAGQQAAGPAPAPAQSCNSVDPAQRTHHLLKHCLSQSQRGAALQQFNTSDPREAAKEIARMGQRELQAKFKVRYGGGGGPGMHADAPAARCCSSSQVLLRQCCCCGYLPACAACSAVLRCCRPDPFLPRPGGTAVQEVYGSATKSNNNSWLRRKLYEAVGVAPLKASTKGKARKAAPSSASRKSGGHGPKDAKARPAKAAAPKARRPASELPASPQGGMSIFDYSDMLSAGTTASDSEDGCGSHGTFPASLHTSAPGTPRSSLGLPFAAGALFDGQPRQQLPSLAPPAGFVPLPGMPQSEPQSPQASGLHWADGLSPAQQPPSTAPFLSAASRSLSMETADGLCGLPGSTFKPMELEQVCTGGASCVGGLCKLLCCHICCCALPGPHAGIPLPLPAPLRPADSPFPWCHPSLTSGCLLGRCRRVGAALVLWRQPGPVGAGPRHPAHGVRQQHRLRRGR